MTITICEVPRTGGLPYFAVVMHGQLIWALGSLMSARKLVRRLARERDPAGWNGPLRPRRLHTRQGTPLAWESEGEPRTGEIVERWQIPASPGEEEPWT